MTTRADEVAAELQGTCKSLHDVATEAEQEDIEFLQDLDDKVFLCEICGWWCELCELSNASIEGQHQLTCDECEPDDADDD